MRDTQRDYSRRLNIRLHRRDHSWENRYFSCPLNPAHAGLTPASKWLDHRPFAERYLALKWREILGLGFRLSGDLDRLREATRTGRPLGSKDFVAELEAKLERNLDPRKRGRKPHPKTNTGSPGESPGDRLPNGE